MILGIHSGDIRVKNRQLQSNTQNVHAPKLPQINPDKIFKYYMPLSFRGLSFSETIDANYFQLPAQAMPDKTQLAAAKSLYDGDNTVCIAPTGTGKTAIANYAITKNLKSGKKTHYTTPLKALSNDKYREFCKLYGEENVGLLTGDIKLKKDAPVLIMTTEIFRNMALSNYANPEKNSFKDVQTVVFDEAHYINEQERGRIWEESMMLAPKGIQILPLTATIGNAGQFSNWIGAITDKKTNLIEASPKDRYVPLVYYNYAPKKQVKFQELIRGKVDIKTIAGSYEDGTLSERQNRAISILSEQSGLTGGRLLESLSRLTNGYPLNHEEFAKKIQKEFRFKELQAQEVTQLLIDSDTRKINKLLPQKEKLGQDDYSNLIGDLKESKKLPAIIFKFSRQGCNDSAREASKLKLELTSEDEKRQIQEIIKKYTDAGIYMGKHFDQKQLLNGVASHNAGLMPGHKKLVEDLFSKKLLKVVFATSTLSAGINMPAKTVVITQLTRPVKGEKEQAPLSANEFHQMSGRAGRRGIDTIGNVVLYNLGEQDQTLAQKLVLQKADPIISKYGPSYNFLTSYYQKNDNDELLDMFIQKTFKVHQSGNYKREIAEDLKEDFENHKKVLTALGFLDETASGCSSNIKGQMLSKVHGYNELTLIEMMRSKKLGRLDDIELACFAASMVSTELEFEDNEKALINELISDKCQENTKFDILNAIRSASDYDKKVSFIEAANNIEPATNKTDTFSAYIGYSWAEATKNGENSIEKFKALLSDPNKKGKEKDFPKFNYNPFKKVSEGNLYNILSQSVDVLKQIINVCEFALSTPELKNDYLYYEKLLKTAQESVKLIKLPPIYDALSVC